MKPDETQQPKKGSRNCSASWAVNDAEGVQMQGIEARGSGRSPACKPPDADLCGSSP